MLSDPSAPDFGSSLGAAMAGSGPAPLEPNAEQRQVATMFGSLFVAYQQAGPFTRDEAFQLIQIHVRAMFDMMGSGE